MLGRRNIFQDTIYPDGPMSLAWIATGGFLLCSPQPLRGDRGRGKSIEFESTAGQDELVRLVWIQRWTNEQISIGTYRKQLQASKQHRDKAKQLRPVRNASCWGDHSTGKRHFGSPSLGPQCFEVFGSQSHRKRVTGRVAKRLTMLQCSFKQVIALSCLVLCGRSKPGQWWIDLVV